MKQYDVIVIGGGPAGLASAISACKENAKVLLVERENRLGGILKQCIHDGFGLIRFKEKLSGPEYAQRYIDEFKQLPIDYELLSFVTKLEKNESGYEVTIVNRKGLQNYQTKTIVLATGCRERTARQVFIHGTRPAGIYTAGTAQYLTNILGQLPTKKCVILGSGDIGLIMARRLTLEGAKVVGVYEAKSEPSGLTRNILQCLKDFDIPLHLSCTVTRVYGNERLEAVEISKVDESMRPIPNTQEKIACDALILSVGLLPENELAEKLEIKLDPKTKGPLCDENLMTNQPGVFSCGNALQVNDLVDYVSESGEKAGYAAAHYVKSNGNLGLPIEVSKTLLYLVPQYIHPEDKGKITFYFRSRNTMKNATFKLFIDDQKVYEKNYAHLKPPEMERLILDFSNYEVKPDSRLKVEVQ